MEYNPQNKETDALKLLKNVSVNCKNVRIQKRMSIKDLSILAGVDEKTIYNIEAGVNNVTLTTMVYICYALEINIFILLNE